MRAPIGPTNLVKDKSCIGRGLAGIKAFGGMKRKFILYQLRTLEKELQEKELEQHLNKFQNQFWRKRLLKFHQLKNSIE